MGEPPSPLHWASHCLQVSYPANGAWFFCRFSKAALPGTTGHSLYVHTYIRVAQLVLGAAQTARRDEAGSGAVMVCTHLMAAPSNVSTSIEQQSRVPQRQQRELAVLSTNFLTGRDGIGGRRRDRRWLGLYRQHRASSPVRLGGWDQCRSF